MTELRFPDLPIYKGWGRPMRVETTNDALVLLQGTPPAGLNGTMYKAGPDRQFPPMHGRDLFIDGEGMVHMFRLHEGGASYRSRWVKSERFNAQKAAGRSLFGEYRVPYDRDPSAADVNDSTANTSTVFSAGKVLVLKEDGLPHEVDPDTLETIGRFDYGGKVKSKTMSAHPKLDPVTDTMLTYGNMAKGVGTLDVAFYEFDHEGNVLDEIWFEAPFAGHVHDFAFTADHVLFLFHPLVTDLETVKRTGLFFQWEPERGSTIAVLKRHGTAQDIRWFNAAPGSGKPLSYGHLVNAHAEGSTIYLDGTLSEGNWIPFHFPEADGKLSLPDPQKLRRIKIDLSRNDDIYETTSDFGMVCELMNYDERWRGHDYRHAWMLVGKQGAPGGASADAGLLGDAAGEGEGGFIDILNGEVDVGHVDLRTGKVETYCFGPRTNIHEPQFVPRAPDSPEGDGWLLVVVNRLAENRSELAIMDALDISAGPVALYDLGARVRSTFHGCWVPEATFKTHKYGMSRVPARG